MSIIYDLTPLENASKNNDDLELIKQCYFTNELRLGKLLSESVGKSSELFTAPIRVRLLCNWNSQTGIRNQWNRQSLRNDYSWESMTIVPENTQYDFTVVINATNVEVEPSKTIIFHMEPHIIGTERWGKWGDVNYLQTFLSVFSHNITLNNIEWHLNKTFNELYTNHPTKTKVLSTILSDKYWDPGHKLRIDFVKELEKTVDIDVYGSNSRNYRKYTGALPPGCKENGLYPYKYTFNAENHAIHNYVTEKLVDAILSETLCFYWGAPNVATLIDPMAYVQLSLEDFEKDITTIQKAIDEDWWSQRIDAIRTEKQRILCEYQFFPRLERGLKEYLWKQANP